MIQSFLSHRNSLKSQKVPLARAALRKRSGNFRDFHLTFRSFRDFRDFCVTMLTGACYQSYYFYGTQRHKVFLILCVSESLRSKIQTPPLAPPLVGAGSGCAWQLPTPVGAGSVDDGVYFSSVCSMMSFTTMSMSFWVIIPSRSMSALVRLKRSLAWPFFALIISTRSAAFT